MIKRIRNLIAVVLGLCIILNLGLTIYAETEYNTAKVEVYITVTDITDYTKPFNIVVPRHKIEVSNFNLADFGDTLDGITAVEGVTYLHALVQLHREIYGDEAVSTKFMLNDTALPRMFMGRSVANVMYKNGKDIFAYPSMINIKDEDELQICLYDESHSQMISTFQESRIDDVLIGEEITLTLSQHYGYPIRPNPLRGAEICNSNGVYVVDPVTNENIKTDKNGQFTVSFNEPGTYTLSAMPRVDYYMSEYGGQIIVEYIPKVETKTEEKTVRRLIGEETIIHDPYDFEHSTSIPRMNFDLFADYSSAKRVEAEEAVLVGGYVVINADNNPIGIDLTKLSNNSGVLLNPGASVTATFETEIADNWCYFGEATYFTEGTNEFYLSVDSEVTTPVAVLDDKKSMWAIDAETEEYPENFELERGIYARDDFTLGTHTITYTASSENTNYILLDSIVYGENVTEYETPYADVSMWLDYEEIFPEKDYYDEELTPEDVGWTEKTTDNRTSTTGPYLTSKHPIVDEYTETTTTEVTVLERVETLIPLELYPKISYTTPLVVINVIPDEVLIKDATITPVSDTTAQLKFGAKNIKYVEDEYTCFVATYAADKRLVELVSVDTLTETSNKVTLTNLNYSYLKIFIWADNMQPLCSAELVDPNAEVAVSSLDWDYTQSKNGYDTYITSPTVVTE